jgi:hypothetical protein
MRSFRAVLFVAIAFAAIPAVAEEPPAVAKPAGSASPSLEPKRIPRPGDVQRVFVLKHVGVNDMARLLSVFPATIGGAEHEGLHALSVSASPAVVAAIEETVKRLDVPPPPTKSVEVSGYILECVPHGTEAGSAPAELQPAIEQLRRTFGYGGCDLAQGLFARARDDARFTTVMVAARKEPGSQGSLGAEVSIDSSQSPAIVRLRRLEYNAPGSGSTFRGDVALRDGQQVIVGKLGSTANGKDQMLVLTAKVVD